MIYKKNRIGKFLQSLMSIHIVITFLASTLMLRCNQVQQLSPPPSEVFFKVFGGGYDQKASDILQSDDDGFLLFGSSSSFSDGNDWDMFLIKTDPDGNEIWSKNYDFNGANDVGNVMIPAHDNGFILCGTSTMEDDHAMVRLLKIDRNGSILWESLKEWIGTGEDIIQTSDGGYLIIGTTSQIDPVKAGGFSPSAEDSTDILAIKVDEMGNESWRKVYGYKGVDKGIAVEDLGNDRYALLGTTDFPENGNLDQDAILILINKEGNPYNTQIYGTSFSEVSQDLALNPNGELVLLGLVGENLRIQKIDGALNQDSEIDLGIIQSGSINPLEDGGYLVLGTVSGGNQRGNDILLIQIDAAGNVSWRQQHGSIGNDLGAKCLPLAQGGVVFTGTIGFGANTMIGLLKTNQNGELIPQ